MFGWVNDNAVIKNIIVKDSSFTGTGDIGGIVANCHGTINNCQVFNVSITNTSTYDAVGGIAGDIDTATVKNCFSNASITCDTAYLGGIVGYSYGKSVISNCVNTGDIVGLNGGYVGGILGYDATLNATMQNCYNTGVITSDYGVGGIAYQVGIASNCYCSEESASVNFQSVSTEKNCKAWTDANMKTTAFLDQLNANLGANYDWLEWEFRSDVSEYPVQKEIVDLSECAVTIDTTSYTYDGTEKKPAVTVTYGDRTLVADGEYTVAYQNNVNAGTASVVVTGINRYDGSVTKTFTINQASVSNATVTLSSSSYTYTRSAIKPSPTVKVGNRTLTKNTDYTVSYKNNTNIGTATVTIKGKGNYAGTITKNYTIKIKSGTIFTVGSYKYKVTGSSTVAFAGLKSTSTTKVKIADTVKYGGQTFKVTAVAAEALKNKTKVTSVTIGANVTSINKNAFYGCTKLSSVTMGSAVTTIQEGAFQKCKALTSITLPSKVKTIGKNAFNGCSKLKTITIKSTKLETVGSNAFKGIKSDATIKVPQSKLTSYKKLLKGKGQGSKVTITKY